MNITIRELQRCIFDIALEFKRICDKNNIKYFLVGGTLLGAARHEGFIPWDDDMDVAMVRSEYEKFLRIAPKELGKGFFLQTVKTDPYYGQGYAKIRLDGTRLVEDYAVDSKQHNGIFLDIFPYDSMPDQKLLQKIHYIRFKCGKWGLMAKSDYVFVNKKKKRFFNVMKILYGFLSQEQMENHLYKICTQYSKRRSKNYINLFGAYNYSEYIDKKELHHLTTLPFEGVDFSVPRNYKLWLTRVYGDYMKLPPVEKRGTQHDMVAADQGNYVVQNHI